MFRVRPYRKKGKCNGSFCHLMTSIRSIQNYTYSKAEIAEVLAALSTGQPLPADRQDKFRFFTLNAAGTALEHAGRTLVATEDQDAVIVAAYAKTYAGINRLHAYIMERHLGVKQSRVTWWLARSAVQQQHRHQPHLGQSKPRIVHAVNDVWQVDILHFHEVYVMVVVDLWSKYFRFKLVANKEAQTLAAALRRLFTPAARPKAVSTDNGGEFQAEFSAMLQRLGIKQVFGHAGNPTSQASVERMNRTIRMALERYLTDGGTNWRRFLGEWAEAYNATKNTSTGFPPAQLQAPTEDVKNRVAARRQSQVQKVLARRRSKRCCPPLAAGDLVRVKIMRKSGIEKRTLPEYSRETFRVTQVRHSKYDYDEYLLSNSKVYQRHRVLKIPEDTREPPPPAPAPVRAPGAPLEPPPPRPPSTRSVRLPAHMAHYVSGQQAPRTPRRTSATPSDQVIYVCVCQGDGDCHC